MSKTLTGCIFRKNCALAPAAFNADALQLQDNTWSVSIRCFSIILRRKISSLTLIDMLSEQDIIIQYFTIIMSLLSYYSISLFRTLTGWAIALLYYPITFFPHKIRQRWNKAAIKFFKIYVLLPLQVERIQYL